MFFTSQPYLFFMPYNIKKQGDKWVKINKETGKVVSHHDSKEKAEASVRAYYANRGKLKEFIKNTIKDVLSELKINDKPSK